MNREIKFKFWDSTNKIMMLDSDGWNENVGINEMFTELRRYETIPLQYTGLKDKNGKEIYESDIIYYQRGYVDDSPADFWQGRNYVIKFERGRFFPYNEKHRTELGFAATNKDDMIMKNYEIIGNIHETPDLLK